jgi:hypothetical protein
MEIPKWIMYSMKIFFIIISLAVISGFLFYKQNSFAILIMVVSDSGYPITQAQVEVLRYSIGPYKGSKLDKDGSLTIISFMPAVEEIIVTAPGYISESYHPSKSDGHKKVFVLKPK